MKRLSKLLRAAPSNPGLDWLSVEHVLLVRLRSIGDTVLMTPCLQALKAFQPGIKTAVLTEDAAAPVLAGHPLVDELIVTPRLRNSARDLARRARLVSELRSKRFDLALNMHGGTTANFLCRMSGARFTGCYASSNWSRLLTFSAPSPQEVLGKNEIHSAEEQLGLLQWAGVPMPENPATSVAVSAAARERANARLKKLGMEERCAIVIPTATLDCKRWAAERFVEVIQSLSSDHGFKVLVVTTTDPSWRDRHGSLVGNAAAIVDDVPLDELIALLGRASLLVCNDGGPAHIRAALAKPLVVIFGSMDPKVWRPWIATGGTPHRVVRAAIEERPFAEDPRKNTEKMEFIRSVAAGEVLAAIAEVVEEDRVRNLKTEEQRG